MKEKSKIHVRDGGKADLKATLELIRQLAAYEHAEGEVELTVEQLEKDGFGENPKFNILIAEFDGEIAGMALLYPRYSTWKGATLYLEDLVVHHAFRGRGIGRALFEAIQRFALKEKAQRLEWQVLDWNEGAITFYERMGTTLDREWINCRLVPSQMRANLKNK